MPERPETTDTTGAGRTVRLVAVAAITAGIALAVLAVLARPARDALAGDIAVEGLALDRLTSAWTIVGDKVERVLDGEAASVVAVGDSSCLVGFSTDALSADGGPTALNLGSHAHVGLPGYRALADGVLARGLARDVLILWVHAPTLERSRARSEAYGFAPWIRARLAGRPTRGGPLAWTNGEWGGLLRQGLLRRHLGRSGHGDGTTPVRELLEEHRGWLPRRVRGPVRHDRMPPPHPEALEDVAAIAAACRARGVTYRILLTPGVAGEVSLEDARAVRRALDAAAGAGAVLPTPLAWPAARFVDPAHLSADAARELTGIVRARLEERR